MLGRAIIGRTTTVLTTIGRTTRAVIAIAGIVIAGIAATIIAGTIAVAISASTSEGLGSRRNARADVTHRGVGHPAPRLCFRQTGESRW